LDHFFQMHGRREAELAGEGLHDVQLLRVIVGHSQVQQTIEST
jgi:hypothetical protein